MPYKLRGMRPINVLSLFDGMGCAWIALRQAGIPLGKCYSSEVDRFAISQVKLNFPEVEHLGSVTDVDVSRLEPIDMVLGGSPCQSFSFAGKRVGMRATTNEEIHTLDRYMRLKADGFQFDGQSYLFWEYMRILDDIRKYNPDVLFLLENVEMGYKWERVLNEAIGIRGVHINAALVSAQNRKRIYWSNIRVGRDGLFGEPFTDIPQPADRGLLLRDVLEDEVDERYLVSPKRLGYITDSLRLKKGYTQIDSPGKSLCLMAKGISSGVGDFVCVAMRGRNPDNPACRKAGLPTQQRIEPREDGKTNCITSVSKDNLVTQLNPLNEFGKQPRQQNRVYDVNGLSPALQHGHAGQSPNVFNGRIRRLTPTECARLQTIPDWYRWGVSETQQYKMLGNGWCVDVIVHILSFMDKNRFN